MKIVTNLYHRGKYILDVDGLKVFWTKGFNFLSLVIYLYIQRIPIIDGILYDMSLRKLKRYMTEEKCLDDIINTAYHFRGFGIYKSLMPTQFREEIKLFAQMCRNFSPKIIVEIGTAYGGVLYILSRYLNSSRKIISIDLDDRFFNLGFFKKRVKLIKEFAKDKEMYFLHGNSHDSLIEAELSRTLNGEKIDLLFIDGDHSYEGLKEDFERYKKYVALGGIIALHDVGSLDEGSGPPRYWNEVKASGYRTKEIIYRGGKKIWGIGVIRVTSGNQIADPKFESDQRWDYGSGP